MMRRITTVVAMALLLFNAAGAFYGGTHLMIHPDGSSLGLSLTFLTSSIFSDYFFPGLVLFTVNGLISLVCLLMVVFRHPHAGEAILCQAALLGGWLAVQLFILQFVYFLHIVMAVVAAGLAVAGILLTKLRNKSKSTVTTARS